MRYPIAHTLHTYGTKTHTTLEGEAGTVRTVCGRVAYTAPEAHGDLAAGLDRHLVDCGVCARVLPVLELEAVQPHESRGLRTARTNAGRTLEQAAADMRAAGHDGWTSMQVYHLEGGIGTGVPTLTPAERESVANVYRINWENLASPAAAGMLF